MFYIFSIGIPCWTANQINHIQRTRNCLSHQPFVHISCPTSSAVNFCTHFIPFFTGLFNTYNWNSNMQRLFRTSSIRIPRQNYCLAYSHCFYRVSLTILSKILIKNFNCKRLRYKKNNHFYYRFCQQNLMKISLSTCSEFGLQVYLLNYMKRAVPYIFDSLSIEKWNSGMSVCSSDSLFTKLF